MTTRSRYPFVLLFVAVSSLAISIIAAPTGSNGHSTYQSVDQPISAVVEARGDANDKQSGPKASVFSSSSSVPAESKSATNNGSRVDKRADVSEYESYGSDEVSNSDPYEITISSDDQKNFVPPEGLKENPIIQTLEGMVDEGTSLWSVPGDKILVLQQVEKGVTASGKIGEFINRGADGSVYNINPPGWSTAPGKETVMKNFKYKENGIKELRNLDFVGELLYGGVDTLTGESMHKDWEKKRLRSLIAIMEKKKGFRLVKLPSAVKAIGTDKQTCKAYMKKIRDAVVDANEPYLKMPGAPSHGDLHQGNVLFEEIDNDGEKIIVARLVDWGRIRWRLTTADKAPADEIKKFMKQITIELEGGYKYPEGVRDKLHFDFSDDGNCYMWVDAQGEPDPSVANPVNMGSH